MVSLRRAAAIASGVAWLETADGLVIQPWHVRWGAMEDEYAGGFPATTSWAYRP